MDPNCKIDDNKPPKYYQSTRRIKWINGLSDGLRYYIRFILITAVQCFCNRFVNGDVTDFEVNATKTDCPNQPDCLKCINSTCIKCPQYIMFDDRRCVHDCPRGYIEQWSALPNLMGRVCRTNGYSDPMLATMAGLMLGAIVCLILVIIGILLMKRKHKRKLIRDTLIDDSIERDEFVKQLDELRPNAEYYLAMLNDTRRQIRKLYLSGDQAGANSYRPIIRDLAKVLILLNRPVELIHKPPHDWHRVYIWALRILDHYKPQVEQLIDFFQSSATPKRSGSDPRLGSSQYSTFKSTITSTTTSSNGGDTMKNIHQMQFLGSLISLHELDEPRPVSYPSTNPFRNSLDVINLRGGDGRRNYNRDSGTGYPSSDIHGSSLWLEDEFFKLGFRPQDEITTEL